MQVCCDKTWKYINIYYAVTRYIYYAVTRHESILIFVMLWQALFCLLIQNLWRQEYISFVFTAWLANVLKKKGAAKNNFWSQLFLSRICSILPYQFPALFARSICFTSFLRRDSWTGLHMRKLQTFQIRGAYKGVLATADTVLNWGDRKLSKRRRATEIIGKRATICDSDKHICSSYLLDCFWQRLINWSCASSKEISNVNNCLRIENYDSDIFFRRKCDSDILDQKKMRQKAQKFVTSDIWAPLCRLHWFYNFLNS